MGDNALKFLKWASLLLAIAGAVCAVLCGYQVHQTGEAMPYLLLMIVNIIEMALFAALAMAVNEVDEGEDEKWL